MDEPALFVPLQSTMPEDVVHPGGGDPKLHGQVHNLYGSQMARAAHEGLVRARPERRPFVITRAGFAGLQRHAMQWTGDNSSWWEHLWMSHAAAAEPRAVRRGLLRRGRRRLLRRHDAELLARWTEFGALQPFCRNHSVMGSAPQEPWAFGEPWESICRDMIALRMRLLPYLYGVFEEAARTGAPILRPLLFEHPDDPATYAADDEFLLGDALLAAPVTRPGIEHRHVYLPAGTWVQWWTGERVDGPAHVLAHAPLGRPALYAAAHAAIPLWPVLQHTGEGPPDALTLRVACAPGAPARERELVRGRRRGLRPARAARRPLRHDARTAGCGSSSASGAAAGRRRATRVAARAARRARRRRRRGAGRRRGGGEPAERGRRARGRAARDARGDRRGRRARPGVTAAPPPGEEPLRLPDPCLVVLVGATAAGKSHWARPGSTRTRWSPRTACGPSSAAASATSGRAATPSRCST